MQLITHQSHLDALPASSEDTDVPPNIILVEDGDDITGPDYAFAGSQGLLSDLFDEHPPGHPEFARLYEHASRISSLYEVLLLINNEDGYWIMIPEAVVDAHPDLKWVLTEESQGGLSNPQPM
jgi:hypothetical protein